VANTKAFKIAATSTITPVANYNDTVTVFNRVGVSNYVNDDVEIYFGQQLVPNIIVPANTDLAFDGFTFQGQAYVKTASGTGDVYLHVWRFDSAGG